MSTRHTLGIWYADPLSPDEARDVLAQSEEREKQRKRHGGNTLSCRMQKMIARYWIGENIHDEYRMLKPAASRSAHGRVLLELIYGQLLLSRRLLDGLPHLEEGFRLGANLFAAGDYLQVMNRHRLLHQLPLSTSQAEAEPLDALLTAARVIERMKQTSRKRRQYSHDPKDTYG